MATLTANLKLRNDLGRSLTNDEVDSNFSGLNTDTIAVNNDVIDVRTVLIPEVQDELEAQIALKQNLNARLTSISGLSSVGLLSLTNTTSGVVEARTLTSSSPLLTVTNATGAAGNPTLDLSSTLLTATSTHTVTNKNINGNNNTISNVSLTSAVKDILPIANGGTNADTAADARANLDVLVQPGTNGIAVRTSLGNSTAREIAVSGTGLSVANGSGVGGNPTITLNSNTASSNNTVVLRDGSGNFAANHVTVSRLTAQNIIQLPDQTATNSTPAAGQVRYNSSTAKFEGYTDQWRPIDTAGAAVGGNDDQVFFENQTTVNYDYQITAGRNAMSVGPITILPGVTVTIGADQRWVIL